MKELKVLEFYQQGLSYRKIAWKTTFIPMTLLLTAVVVSVDPLLSDANATIGSDEFCNDNPSHYACDNKVGNQDEDDYDEEKEK